MRLKSVMTLLAVFFFAQACVSANAQNWTEEDKTTWKKAIKRVVTTPPCCGACSVLGMIEGRQAYRYVLGEDTSAESKKIYIEHEKRILEAFKYFNPERYHYWFEKDTKEIKNEK